MLQPMSLTEQVVVVVELYSPAVPVGLDGGSGGGGGVVESCEVLPGIDNG